MQILCEDTRRTAQLLNHLGIKAHSVESFHQHNEHGKAAKVPTACWMRPPGADIWSFRWLVPALCLASQIIGELQRGAAIAVVSDAGTPCINDPGSELVALATAKGLPIIPVPGPSALLAALVASGLPTATFLFCGFVEGKASARKKAFAAVQGIPHCMA